MKRRVILFTFAFFSITALFSQNQMQERKVIRAWSSQMQSEKIAFFTAEMRLTPEEAATFWPVYNQYWNERMAAHDRVQWNLNRISEIINDKNPENYDELKRLTREYVESLSFESSIYKRYYEKFSVFLPVEKIARLYMTEERFRMKMIMQLKQGERPKESKRP
jgi:hypothetical protein